MISICPYEGTLKNLAQVLLSLFYSCGNWDREGQWPRSDKYALIWHQSPSSLPQKLNVCYHMPNGKDYVTNTCDGNAKSSWNKLWEPWLIDKFGFRL